MRNKKYKLIINTIFIAFLCLFALFNFKNTSNNNYFTSLTKKIKAELSSNINYNKKEFNIIGIRRQKKIPVIASSDIKVVPGGQSIGVKLFTDGILVVGFSDIETENGKKLSPAAIAGVELGDRILEANEQKLTNSKMFAEIISKSINKELKLKVVRKNEIKMINVMPIYLKNKNQSKIGLWIRDSTAGVGTMTFYIPENNIFGALGHPINDMDTGMLIKIKDGKLYNAKVISIEQGLRGKPGELRGIFSDDDELGKIEKNTNQGIYGKITKLPEKSQFNQPMYVAKQGEIKEGPAKILASIDDGPVREYEINIDKLTSQSRPGSKSMIIRVTDKELLGKTGGIVQGMSGSPIIQNGKIVGAVTHVFVNRPDMGYGIYIEWMLKEIGIDL